MAETGMAAILSAVGSYVTAAVGWMGTVIGSITASGNELLLLGFIMAVSGFAVGLFHRLVRI
jgi:hypothetical protein